MKTAFLTVLLVIFSISLWSQGYMWTKQFKGTGQANPTDVIQDNSGNYYVYGNFNGEIKVDTVTVNAVALQDVFIAKFNGTGQLQWFKTIAGSGTESAYGIDISNDEQYIYLSGVFNNTLSFFGQTTIYNNGGNDIYLSKIDLNGNIIWAKNIAYGPTHQMGGYFDIDGTGNIIMVGQFTSSITFYNDLYHLTLAAEDMYQKQSFVAKFNADGNPLWSKLFYGTSDLSYIRNVSLVGNEYFVSGQVAGSVTYDGKPLFTIPASISAFRSGLIMKLDANGNMVWNRKILTTNKDLFVIRHTSDLYGNQYITGKFASYRIKFDSTATDTSKKLYYNVTSVGTYDLFVAKYSRSGSFQWAKLYGSIKDENVININYTNGQLMLTGSYGAAMNIGNIALDFKAQSDGFLALLDQNGTVSKVLNAKGKLAETGNSGYFSNTARNFAWIGEFYSDTLFYGTNTLINDYATKRDGFLTRYGCFDSVSFVVTKISCSGLNDGSATVNPSYGSEPYTYLWSNGSTSQTVSNLSAGTYIVTVVGSNNCSLTQSVSLTQVPTLSAEIINIQDIGCWGSNTGSATANPVNGTPPYTYRWSNNKTTQIITDIPAGVYSVTITDNCGTKAIASATIYQDAKVDASVSGTTLSCNGGADGTATATPIGGLSPYTYRWSNGQTTQTAVGLSGGTTYKVTVKDGCANSVVKTISLSEPTALAGTVTTYASSTCQPTGTAVAEGIYGTPPYTYKWNTGATTASISNLSANTTYTVTIKDACLAQKSISKTVGAKTITITITSTCTPSGTCQGALKATVVGGDAPYTYLWDNGQTTQTAVNLCRGRYAVTVTDALGCTKSQKNLAVNNCAKSFITEQDNSNEDVDQINKDIVIYPNPANELLNIKIPVESMDEYYGVEIYDVIGNLVYKQKPELVQDQISLNVSNFAEGIYMIKIIQGNNLFQRKIIISR